MLEGTSSVTEWAAAVAATLTSAHTGEDGPEVLALDSVPRTSAMGEKCVWAVVPTFQDHIARMLYKDPVASPVASDGSFAFYLVRSEPEIEVLQHVSSDGLGRCQGIIPPVVTEQEIC